MSGDNSKSDDIKWGSIILENGHLSLGRVLCILTFGILCYFWFSGTSVPSSLLTTFYTCLGYNVSKKFSDPMKSYLDGKLEEHRKQAFKEAKDAEGEGK